MDSARAALRYQFIIDSLDVWLPATNLGFVHLDDGILGFTGYVFLSILPRDKLTLIYF
jgi:peroxin-11B